MARDRGSRSVASAPLLAEELLGRQILEVLCNIPPCGRARRLRVCDSEKQINFGSGVPESGITPRPVGRSKWDEYAGGQ